MSETPPVLIVANDAGGTGSVSSVVRNHARELARRGPVILIAATLPEPLPPGVQGVAVDAPQLTWLRRFAHVPREVLLALALRRAVQRVCRAQPVTALFVHSHALGAIVGRGIRREFGLPWLLAVHADIHDRPPGSYDRRVTAFYRWVTPIAYRHADRVLAISRQIAEAAIKHGARPERVCVVPNGIDPAEIGLGAAAPAQHPTAQSAPLCLLFVGRLSPEKGVADLLDACSRLAGQGIAFRLRIAGDGPLRGALQGQAAALGLGERVEFLGPCPRTGLGPLYRDAGLACVPSLSEPQGIVVLESLIAGTPVLATAVGGIPDMVRDGSNGRLVPARRPEQLAAAIAELAADRAALARLAAASRPSVEADYAWPAIGRRLHAILDDLASPL